MTNWRHTIKLKDLLDSDDDVREIGQKMYCRLYNDPWFNAFRAKEQFQFIETEREINILLDELYDFADEHLIWIE